MDKTLRPAVIAGNWKMNLNRQEAVSLMKELAPLVKDANCQVLVCPPFTDLDYVLTYACLLEGRNIRVGAQNCHWEASGAFTGEISPWMLSELGVEYVIVGHSERRQYFGETDETVNARVKAALSAGLKVILCVGETLQQREDGVTEEVISTQVKRALKDIPLDQLRGSVIAYEPVWAIGTGRTATAQQAGEVCGFIRDKVAGLYGRWFADHMSILYGGSMKAGNAAELLAQEDVDGGLIGGASLKAEEFAAIVAAASC